MASGGKWCQAGKVGISRLRDGGDARSTRRKLPDLLHAHDGNG
jgi:hypothetical protein